MIEIRVKLPTFHPDQVKAFKLIDPKTGKRAKRKVIRCGRRWGKTDYGKVEACDGAIKGQNIGWFAPDYKIQSEAYSEILDILEPVKLRASQTAGVIRTKTQGRIDFWTLDNERAGRSRKYNKILIDEGAFTDDSKMMAIWEQSIAPTLLDFDGQAIVMSNTNGNNPENFLYRICNDPKYGFVEYHAPTFNNPYIPAHKADESPEEYMLRREKTFDELKTNNHPLVYQQEYLAEFVDWSGEAFFSLEKLLADGKPVDPPTICDAVFAVIDTAVKDGQEHDGTAVIYYAISKKFGIYPLCILDWDLIQIEGALLETWLPTVYQNLEALAKSCGARFGSIGAFIEDKASGSILLQQARNRNWAAEPLDTKLTALGKDARAISVSGYVYQGLTKVSKLAYDKTTTFKGTTRNHMISQVVGFRVGEGKEGAKRADDLLDCFCYGNAIAHGNAEGF